MEYFYSSTHAIPVGAHDYSRFSITMKAIYLPSTYNIAQQRVSKSFGLRAIHMLHLK